MGVITVQKKELALGVVRRDELYTIQRLKVALGLTDSALRAMRLAGLPVVRFGKRGFVLGSHVLRFMEQKADAQ